jgi:hypothetical protein
LYIKIYDGEKKAKIYEKKNFVIKNLIAPIKTSTILPASGYIPRHNTYPLQLGLGRLHSRHQQVADIPSRLVEVEAHLLASESLGYDVEADAARAC